MSKAKRRVIVVGGGIIGCMTAWFLHRLGAEPIIIERGQVGQESSWAGAGILCPIQPWLYPDSFSYLIQHSLKLFPDVQAEIEKLSGISAQWVQNGLLIPSFAGEQDMHKALGWSKRFSWQVQAMNQIEAQQDTPLLSKDVQGAVLWKDIAQVRNPRLMQGMLKVIKKLNITCMQGCDVDKLLLQQGKVSGIEFKGGQQVKADSVLLAAGSWSGILAKKWGVALDVQPVKGQIALLKTKPNRLQRIVKHHTAYFVPRQDGRILVGASMESVGFQRGTTEHEIQHLLEAVKHVLPNLCDAQLEHQWMGFRPGSPDGMPYLGPAKQIPGLWVSTGHYRNGVALAPISADMMSRWILGEQPVMQGVNIDCFSIERQNRVAHVGYPEKSI